MTKPSTITAALLIIGDEILSGRTRDKNIHYIASHCTLIGIDLLEVRVIGDDVDLIARHVNELRLAHNYLFTTGGIGPTHDDMTAKAIAKAFDVPLDYHDEALALLLDHYGKENLTKARKQMALIPEGAVLIKNSLSKAPGFRLENVIVMAGVPAVMEVMLDDVTPHLKTGQKHLSANIFVYHPESALAGFLSQLQDQFDQVQFGSYPFFEKGKVGANLVMRSRDKQALDKAHSALVAVLEEKNLTYSVSGEGEI